MDDGHEGDGKTASGRTNIKTLQNYAFPTEEQRARLGAGDDDRKDAKVSRAHNNNWTTRGDNVPGSSRMASGEQGAKTLQILSGGMPVVPAHQSRAATGLNHLPSRGKKRGIKKPTVFCGADVDFVKLHGYVVKRGGYEVGPAWVLLGKLPTPVKPRPNDSFRTKLLPQTYTPMNTLARFP